MALLTRKVTEYPRTDTLLNIEKENCWKFSRGNLKTSSLLNSTKLGNHNATFTNGSMRDIEMNALHMANIEDEQNQETKSHMHLSGKNII